MMKQMQFYLPSIKCAGCVNKITNHLNKLQYVDSFSINFATKSLDISFNNTKITPNQIIASIEKIGHKAQISNQELENLKAIQYQKQQKTLLFKAITALIFGIALMYINMNNLIFNQLYNNISYISFECIFVLILILYTGNNIFKNAYNSAKNLSTNMHTLISLGIASAYIYSVFVDLAPFLNLNLAHHSYFESALIIIALVNLGRYIENKANHSTLSAINALFNLLPPTITILKENQEISIPIENLQINDIVKIVAGDKIPCDGVVIQGIGYVDEAMLTGEANYVKKLPDSIVTGGTINHDGSFTFKVTHVGTDTVLNKIIALVTQAQNSKPKYAKLADTIAKIFVPSVIGIAIISAIVWFIISNNNPITNALTVFMSVLIIACPCSIGLAIPMSLMVGLSRAAKNGILFKKTDIISNIDKINYILLDKTGTITEGKPKVVNAISYNNTNPNELINIAKALENHSKHPIAKAILEYQTNLTSTYLVTNFHNETGSGITGTINNTSYYIGNYNYISNIIGTTEANLANNIATANHHTVIYIANQLKLLGIIEIADSIKPDSIDTISTLKKMGYNIAILSGDNKTTTANIAQITKIDNVFAELSPQAKVEIVKKLQNQDNKVIFVGDGINDAIALSQADIGIAIGSGSDIAIGVSDITIMGNKLNGIINAIKTAKAINRNMKQNLFGAFIYNSIAILIATGISYPILHTLLNPMIASITMSLSSITVILNANRLVAVK